MICVRPQSDLSKVRSHSSCDRFTHPLNGDCIRAKYAGREKKATLAQYEDANGIQWTWQRGLLDRASFTRETRREGIVCFKKVLTDFSEAVY